MVCVSVQWCLYLFSGVCDCSVVSVSIQWYLYLFSGICVCSVVSVSVQWYLCLFSGVSVQRLEKEKRRLTVKVSGQLQVTGCVRVCNITLWCIIRC